MFIEMTTEGINKLELTYTPGDGTEEKITFAAAMSFYNYYPPIISTAIGYALVHPEINLNGFDLSDDPNRCSILHNIVDNCDSWNHKHGDAFKHAFGPPLLGYLVGFFLWQTILVITFTTKRERANNALRGSMSRISWNIDFVQQKLACAPGGTIANIVGTTILSSATTATYAVFGASILGQIPDVDTAYDLAITHAIGGAVIPALLTSGCVIYRALKNGELMILPPAGYYTLTCFSNANYESYQSSSQDSSTIVDGIAIDPEVGNTSPLLASEVTDSSQFCPANVGMLFGWSRHQDGTIARDVNVVDLPERSGANVTIQNERQAPNPK